jgi:hypothetical protein
MAKQRRSYAWSLLVEVADVPVEALSPTARRGLEFAQELAADASRRSACNYDWNKREPLTVAKLARAKALAETTVLPPRPLPSAAFWASEVHPRQEEPP